MDEATGTASLLAAAAVAAAMALDQPVAADRLGTEGCRVWHQPGAALVVGPTWAGGQGLSALCPYSEDRAAGLLMHLPEYVRGVPPAPREEEYAAGRIPPPQVYLLNGADACARLRRYYQGYEAWMLDAPETVVLTSGELEAAAAVVYAGEGGSLELYFAIDDTGKARVIHLVHYDYFSA